MTTNRTPIPNSSELEETFATNGGRRELLKDRAYRELKALIQSGELEPHCSVSERQLAARLGMSKTPIRTALENLEIQGLVAVSPQKGILIKELSAREANELFELRNAIEPYVVTCLVKRSLSSRQLDELKQNLDRQGSAARREDAVACTTLDIEFHRMLVTMFSNREMYDCLERCFDKLHRSVLRINRLVPGRLRKSIDDHTGIVKAIEAGNATKASERMLAHLQYGRQFLLRIDDNGSF